MNSLSIEDFRHLEASEGWLGLGDLRSAREELEQISLPQQRHPAVLRVRFKVLGEAGDWDGALVAAEALTEILPHEVEPWISRSYALHELKRTAEAKANLLGVAEKFSQIALVAYNLACYEAQLGNVQRARELLDRALELPGGEELRQTALVDPDLEPLR